MSVIFESLNKLRHTAATGRRNQYRSRNGPLSPFGRKMLLFSAVALFVVFTVVMAFYASRPLVANGLAGAQNEGAFLAELMPASQAIAAGQTRGSDQPTLAGRITGKDGGHDATLAAAFKPPGSLRPGTCPTVSLASQKVTAPGAPHARSGPMPQGASRLSGKTPEAGQNPVHLVNVEKQRKITALIARIEKSLAASDLTQAGSLVDTLAAMKPKQDRYVLKLRAYLAMRQGDLASAASSLASVLACDEDDLEAGLNMAVVEIKTDRLTKARQRLARLRERYPEDTRIADLMDRIGG